MESFSAPQTAKKTDKQEQPKTEYTAQPIYEDPLTGLYTVSVSDGDSHFVALTGSYQDLEQFARQGQTDYQPLDKTATWRIVTSKLLNFAPAIGAGVGAGIGFFVGGVGAVPGAAMGAAIGQAILTPKAAVEAITGKDYIANEKVEGIDRAFAGLNAVLGGAAITCSTVKIVGAKVIATGVELAQGASKVEKVEVMGHTLIKHTLDNMAGERHITKDLLQQVLEKGVKFKDANYPGAVRYVLEGGISGQRSDLSLAINPVTKTIITVMRGKSIIGRNLRNGRFTQID